MTATRKDEKIARLIADYGLTGYGLWWSVLEVVAASLDIKTHPHPSVTYPVSTWSDLLSLRGSHVRQALVKLEVTHLVTAEWSGNDLTVTIPNLLKYRDEYSQRSGQTPDSVPSKKQKQKQIQKQSKTFSSPASPMMVPPILDAEVVEPGKDIQPRIEERQLRWFDQFWFLYWRKADKQTGLATFRKHAKTEAEAKKIITAVKEHSPYYHLRESNFKPLAATWLNKRRYLEPFDESLPKIECRSQTRTESAQLAAEARFAAKHRGDIQ